jgi:hypothetical protein
MCLLFVAAFAIGQQSSSPQIGSSNTPKPKLPVVDFDACPGKGQTVSGVKISQAVKIYSSWQPGQKSIGTLRAGEKVTIVSGANVIREPGKATIKYVGPDDPPSLKVGDEALVYGLEANENVVVWSNGTWFGVWIEAVAEKGQCGFTSGFGPGGCSLDIVDDGTGEWWVQAKTSSGLSGWVLASKYEGGKRWNGNFSDVCRYGED